MRWEERVSLLFALTFSDRPGQLFRVQIRQGLLDERNVVVRQRFIKPKQTVVVSFAVFDERSARKSFA